MYTLLIYDFVNSGKEKHLNKFGGLPDHFPGLGGWQKCVLCVCWVIPVIPYRGEKHKQNCQQNVENRTEVETAWGKDFFVPTIAAK